MSENTKAPRTFLQNLKWLQLYNMPINPNWQSRLTTQYNKDHPYSQFET